MNRSPDSAQRRHYCTNIQKKSNYAIGKPKNVQKKMYKKIIGEIFAFLTDFIILEQ